MTIGKFYEVSFNVEAYQSNGGSADVTVSFGTTGTNELEYTTSKRNIFTNSLRGHITITEGSAQKIVFKIPAKSYIIVNIFNLTGKKVAEIGKKEYQSGEHTLNIDNLKLNNGLYYYSITSEK